MTDYSWDETNDDEDQGSVRAHRRAPAPELRRTDKTRRRTSPQTVNGIHRRRAKRIRW